MDGGSLRERSDEETSNLRPNALINNALTKF